MTLFSTESLNVECVPNGQEECQIMGVFGSPLMKRWYRFAVGMINVRLEDLIDQVATNLNTNIYNTKNSRWRGSQKLPYPWLAIKQAAVQDHSLHPLYHIYIS